MQSLWAFGSCEYRYPSWLKKTVNGHLYIFLPATSHPHNRSCLLHPCRINPLQTVHSVARSLRQQESFPAHGRHSSARKEAVLCFLPFNHLLDLKPGLQTSLKIRKGQERKKGRKEEGREERESRVGKGE